MPVLLQINQISKTYGARSILDSATASFSSEQKIGMIGRNGAGKSTLCRILTGHENADEGEITRNSLLKLSYLEQHDVFKPGESVLDYLMRSTGAEAWQCGATAIRFHIDNDMLDQIVQSLPGGYQTRVKLTAMLLREPNFLILDEPSNYLDLSTLILLENFLIDFRGGYLIVSHDREFLKRTCDHTLELESGQLTLYPGDIEEYFEFKDTELAQKEAYNRGVEKKRDQLQEFINRFRAKASTASRAQSKIKQLDKLKTIEIGHKAGKVRIYMPQVEKKSGRVFWCEDLTIGYAEKDVAKGIHFEIERGRHVAVLGDNGQGKTTFLRTIAGDLPAKAGTFQWGTGMKTGYYAQHVFSTLDPEDTIYAYLIRESPDGITSQDVLNMAGCFLFKGDDVKKKVKILSGGERARLVLAGLLLSKNPVLLLDEPTNHLDFETVEALGQALKNFTGTVFFISHDRTFVNLVATNIIEVKNAKVRRYPGTYEDYVYHLESEARHEREEAHHTDSHPHEKSVTSAAAKDQEKTEGALVKKKTEGPPKKSGSKSEIAKIKRRMTEAEKRMKSSAEERDKLLEEVKKNPFFYSKDRNKRLKELQTSVEVQEAQWCLLQEKLDKLDKD